MIKKGADPMKVLLILAIFFLSSCDNASVDKEYAEKIAFGSRDDIIEALRHEIASKNGPDEIYALISSGPYVNEGNRVVRVKAGKAEISYYHPWSDVWHNPWVKDLSDMEYAELKKSLLNADKLEPLGFRAYDAVEYVYVHLWKDGSVIVRMNNPDDDTPEHIALVEAFQSLASKKQLKGDE